MGELGIDLGLIVSQVVNFGLLLVLLYVLLYGPVLRKLKERAKRIKEGQEEADQGKQLLADAQAHYQEEMERARREARAIVEQATGTAEQQRQEILAQARQEAHELIQRAQQQAQHELQEGQIMLQQQIIDLAIASASRILEENLGEDKQHALVAEFLAEIGALND